MTRRQQIIEILEKQKQTAQQLANYFQCELKDILEDLEHLKNHRFLMMIGNLRFTDI